MSAARNLAPSSPEERIARAIAAVRADLEPDPLFQRRLRSQVLGRYVSMREGGSIEVTGRGREMGRLGRAVLYASFVLGVSVTSVMAASQQAVPGDVLYPLKRDIEALRHRVLPEEFEGLLFRSELTARLDELATVADRGGAAALTRLAAEVHRSYGEMIELAGASPQNLVVLDALLDGLPAPAHAAVRDVALEVDRAAHPSPSHPPRGQGRRDEIPGQGRGQGEGKPPAAAPPTDGDPAASAPTSPSASPEASASSQAQPSDAPSGSARPDAQDGDQGEDE